jgi:hypothetical protein
VASEKCVLQDVEKGRQRRSRVAQRLNVRLKVRLASSFAAALLNDLFDHPAEQLSQPPLEPTVPFVFNNSAMAC